MTQRLVDVGSAALELSRKEYSRHDTCLSEGRVVAKREVQNNQVAPKKKFHLKATFPGQTHFPEISPPLGLGTLLLFIAFAVAASVVVWWLKS